jgi:Arc/MetJ-type ribon-helix-helix transcriptional regulator
MNVIPVRIPDKIVEVIDKLVEKGIYANRSAAVRVIVTNYILNETNILSE